MPATVSASAMTAATVSTATVSTSAMSAIRYRDPAGTEACHTSHC